jgi:hypothetical protein
MRRSYRGRGSGSPEGGSRRDLGAEPVPDVRDNSRPGQPGHVNVPNVAGPGIGRARYAELHLEQEFVRDPRFAAELGNGVHPAPALAAWVPARR